jgi:hypothetical protein
MIPAGARNSVTDVVGRVPSVPIGVGQIVTRELVADRLVSPSVLRIGRGRVGITIETGAARPELLEGFPVVVIASPDAQTRGGSATVEATVVAVGDRFVTVSVAESEAPKLASFMAGGPVYIALKGAS